MRNSTQLADSHNIGHAVTPEVSLDRGLGFLLRDVHRNFARLLQSRISSEGMTLGMWYFLRVLWEEEGLSQRELSRRIGTMEPTTVSALSIMEERGLVRRVTDPRDRRRRIVYLTDLGRSLKERALALDAEVNAIAASGLDQQELATLMRLLGSLRENLDEALEGDPGEPVEHGTPLDKDTAA